MCQAQDARLWRHSKVCSGSRGFVPGCQTSACFLYAFLISSGSALGSTPSTSYKSFMLLFAPALPELLLLPPMLYQFVTNSQHTIRPGITRGCGSVGTSNEQKNESHGNKSSLFRRTCSTRACTDNQRTAVKETHNSYRRTRHAILCHAPGSRWPSPRLRSKRQRACLVSNDNLRLSCARFLTPPSTVQDDHVTRLADACIAIVSKAHRSDLHTITSLPGHLLGCPRSSCFA